jgi:hypothetical protein
MPDGTPKDRLEYDPAIYGDVTEDGGDMLPVPPIPSDAVIRTHLLALCHDRGLDKTTVPGLMHAVRAIVQHFIENRGDRIIDRFTFSEALTVAQLQIEHDKKDSTS